MAERVLIARRVFRTGVQSLYREGDRHVLTIANRTYRSEAEVPAERAPLWIRALEAPSGAKVPIRRP